MKGPSTMSKTNRLPNGLTPEQDAAFDALAAAVVDYYAEDVR